MNSDTPFSRPVLPEAAWHLLEALRAQEEGVSSPALEHLYIELRKAGLVDGYKITQAGEEALRHRFPERR